MQWNDCPKERNKNPTTGYLSSNSTYMASSCISVVPYFKGPSLQYAEHFRKGRIRTSLLGALKNSNPEGWTDPLLKQTSKIQCSSKLCTENERHPTEDVVSEMYTRNNTPYPVDCRTTASRVEAYYHPAEKQCSWQPIWKKSVLHFKKRNLCTYLNTWL